MKLATFNINNINRRLPNLLRWLKAAKPDVVCLQELKCTDEAFPARQCRRPAIMRCGVGSGPGMGWRSWHARNRS